jgi:threonine dehydrogenase-like Zn-dependent dehydrogenase
MFPFSNDAIGWIKPADTMRREVTIKGSFRAAEFLSTGTEVLESGEIKVDEIVTHEIPLPEYAKTLELAPVRTGILSSIIPEDVRRSNTCQMPLYSSRTPI